MIEYKPSAMEAPGISHPTSRRWLWSAGVAGVAMLAAGAAVVVWPEQSTKASPGTSAPAPAPRVPVSVAVVEQHDTAIWSDFSGRLEAVGRVELRPRVAGAIVATHFREGALVRQGDLLFTVDPLPYAAEVRRL